MGFLVWYNFFLSNIAKCRATTQATTSTLTGSQRSFFAVLCSLCSANCRFCTLVLVVAELLLPISLPAFLLCSCTVHPFKLNCATNCRFYLPVLHSLSRLQYTRWYYWK